MPTRLARQAVTAAALRGDGPGLAHSGTSGYDQRRAAAFRAALTGDRRLALGELGLGGGVRSVRLGLDIAIIELLTRGAGPAVEAVRLALRDGVHGEPDVPLVLAACVRLDPEVARSALGVALSGGTPLERTRAAAAVIGAARPFPVHAAVPAVVAVSLAVAALAFMRLPSTTDPQEAATPRLEEPHPAVVVAAPPRGVVSGSPRGDSPQSVTPDAVPIAVRFTPGGSGSGSGSADGIGSLNGREGSRPATPRPTPTTPPADRPSTPPPTMPSPSSPTPPVSSPPPVTSQVSTAARPGSAPPAAVPPAEPPRQPAVAKPSKAERKADKAERKAEKAEAKAARKADKAAPVSAAAAQPAPLTLPSTPQPEAAVAPDPAPAPESDDERRSKPDKPEKPEKAEKPEKDK